MEQCLHRHICHMFLTPRYTWIFPHLLHIMYHASIPSSPICHEGSPSPEWSPPPLPLILGLLLVASSTLESHAKKSHTKMPFQTSHKNTMRIVMIMSFILTSIGTTINLFNLYILSNESMERLNLSRP